MDLKNQKNNAGGFTLIELLVVISIIGLLSSVVLATLGTARARARDTERRQNLIQLRNALESHFSSTGTYPSTVVEGTRLLLGQSTTCPTEIPTFSSRPVDQWIPGLVNGNYISKLPVDPRMSGCNQYLYTSDGKDYKIIAFRTGESGTITFGTPFARYPVVGCFGDTSSFAIQNRLAPTNVTSVILQAGVNCW